MLVLIKLSPYICNQQHKQTRKGKRKAAGPEPNNLSQKQYGKGKTIFRKPCKN